MAKLQRSGLLLGTLISCIVATTSVSVAEERLADELSNDTAQPIALPQLVPAADAIGMENSGMADGSPLVLEEPLPIDDPLLLEDAINAALASDVEKIVVASSKLPKYEFGDWLGYNPAESDWTWLPAGDDLGMFSMQSHPSLTLGEQHAIDVGVGLHFLNGPTRTDMPPRLFDLETAFLSRTTHGSNFMLDLKVGVGVFSDFEGSAREGVRFPGHAVGYYEVHSDLAAVFGVDVLDRDDISVLPVAGVVWRPTRDLVCELVFPRPRLQLRFSEQRAFYVGAELGGDSWAIERVNGANDVATYRDIRIFCGIMQLDDARQSVLEIGYAMDRRLEYRSGLGDYSPEGTLLLRLRQNF